MIAATALLSAVTIERICELWLARRNTKSLLEHGAYEAASKHYCLIVALHTLWLGGLWILAWNRQIDPAWLLIFAALQALRIWVLATLGRRWTTRIIVVPGSSLVRRGPYRYVSHPNYFVVVGEIAVLPLCFGLGRYALIFSLLNAAVLAFRIREENSALRDLRNDSKR
ncbi:MULTISPECIES: isoprenylcysteine carboxyl methyltransferase family protein [Phyllobacterium]|jgi:methyltransferase|uniref:isoprenylcysteine carboxyl methyltransferase family protein n=1 Tax=Phyllobacterium TaxID=28100 RepID=UPI001CC0545F|nr:isoprenylcysteine carboxylmethyltransferase family protein [Phyllobacterium calauticae]MBZ3695437.1 hypothetical protein [Phyllobacterium calauticae]